MDDRDIVALYLDRNEQAIKECQGKYGTMCHTLARRILGDDLDSEECVNDTWMAAWKSIPPNKPAALAPYLGRIVRNLALNRWKQNHRHKRYNGITVQLEELAECIPDTAEESGDMAELFNTFLSRLDETERNLFMGRYWYNYRVEDLATSYGLSENAVHLRIKRTRDKLKVFLEERGYRI